MRSFNSTIEHQAEDPSAARRDDSSLTGLRVLELEGDVATRYCGRMFSTHGAEVVQAGRFEDTCVGQGGEAGRAYGRWLDAGKRAVRIDGVGGATPADWQALAVEVTQHLSGVDVVIAGQSPGVVRRAQGLCAAMPDPPVLAAIEWFDPLGPYGEVVGSDEVIMALVGGAYCFGPIAGPPTVAQGHAPQILAGAQAFTVALAALMHPRQDRPKLVEVNVLESALCLTEIMTLAGNSDGRPAVRLGVNRFAPTYPTTSYETADGWIGVTAMTPPQWAGLAAMIDRPDLLDDPQFETAARRLRQADAVDDALSAAFATKSTDWCVEQGLQRRIPIVEVVRPGALLHQSHWRERGTFRSFDEDGALAAPCPPYRMLSDGAAAPASRAPVGRPLDGVRIVDLTMGWAGPQASRMLADLGADVIKVEGDEHPDWYRGWEQAQQGDPPEIEIRARFNSLNRDKRGVTLDLQSPQGVAKLLDLVSEADVVMENFASGVLDRLGLGPARMHEVRPGLVSLSMTAFGETGPLAGARAYGSTMEQASGLPFVNGSTGWPPAQQHVAFGDPVAGVFAAAGVVVALFARQAAGGRHIDMAQVECLFQIAADAVIAEQLVPGGIERHGSNRPPATGRTCMVLPAVGEDSWVVASGRTADADWRRLEAVVEPSLPAEAPAPERTDLSGQGDGVSADLVDQLRARGLSAAEVRRPESLISDAHLVATGVWQRIRRRHVGEHTVAAPGFRIDGMRPAIRRPAPTLGEHNQAILGTGWPGVRA